MYDWLNKRHQRKTLKKMGLPPSYLSPNGHSKWKDWLAKRELRDTIRAARPWWLQAWGVVDMYLFGWNGLIRVRMNPRNIYNHHVWNRQRVKRGWCDRDVWCMDQHLARIAGEMCLYLADNNHAYPGHPPFETPEKWDAHLRDIGERLMTWDKKGVSADTNEDETSAHTITKTAMQEFARNYGLYGD